ncbi:MAG: hypothetical protein K9H48_19430 [Melioribacteraceae bacterium]|nr:hypothetical protein [Melioribacteraceae bacterium]
MLDVIFGIIGAVIMLWILYWMFAFFAYIGAIIVLPIYHGIIKPVKNHIEEKRKKKLVVKYPETKSVSYTPSQIKSLMDSVDYSKHPIGSAGYEYNKRRQREKNK